jgi:hypothetical protein
MLRLGVGTVQRIKKEGALQRGLRYSLFRALPAHIELRASATRGNAG